MDRTINGHGQSVRRQKQKTTRPAIERFLAKIVVNQIHDWDSTPCWDWAGHVNETTGYGQLKDDHQRTVNAHAFSYDQFVGGTEDLGPGFELTQGCGRRICCSPHHIYPIRRADNKKRRKFRSK